MRPHHKDVAGDWQGADSPTHAPRYAAIAEILHSFSADASVVDVGCGEAALRAWLPKDARYIGIEPSGAAVQIALERNTSANIVHTRAENFDSCGERFDSIVFNEMLYYADDPIGLLKKVCGSGQAERPNFMFYLPEAGPCFLEKLAVALP